MQRKVFDILVNFEKSDSITSDEIKIVQGDYNSIEFDFQLSKNDYAKAMFYMVKPSGLHYACEITQNKVIFTDNVAFNEVGKYLYSIALYGADSRLTNTVKADLTVVDGNIDMDDEIVSQDNYLILDSLINDVIDLKDELQETMTQLNDVFVNVSYNGTNGVMTFTQKDGSTVKVDLPLELLVKSGHYSSSTKSLVLVLANNDTINIPVGDLIDEYFADGTTIELKTVNGKQTFNVKNGVYQEKVSGKGLSTNDFTNDYKSKVDSNTSSRHSHSNKSVLDGTTASFTTAYKNTLDSIKTVATTGNFEDLTNKSVAGYHNSIFRGKNVTSYLDDGTLFTRISNGTFEDLFVGDYIVKNSITWRIAGFDVYYNKGDQNSGLTTHHAIIVPDKHLTTAYMNDTNTSVGGYVGSKMYTETLPSVLSTYITPIFGTHVIEYRNVLTNSINATGYNRFGNNGGCSNGWAWYSRKLDLMNEVQVYGSIAWSSSGYDIGSDNCQLPLFRLAPQYITNRSYWYWLRSVTTASAFAHVDIHGISASDYASGVGGDRPCFYID